MILLEFRRRVLKAFCVLYVFMCFGRQERIFRNGKHALLVGCSFSWLQCMRTHTQSLWTTAGCFLLAACLYTHSQVGTQVWVNRPPFLSLKTNQFILIITELHHDWDIIHWSTKTVSTRATSLNVWYFVNLLSNGHIVTNKKWSFIQIGLFLKTLSGCKCAGAFIYENTCIHYYFSSFDGKIKTFVLSPSLQDTLRQLIVMPLPDILCIARDPISGNTFKRHLIIIIIIQYRFSLFLYKISHMYLHGSLSWCHMWYI